MVPYTRILELQAMRTPQKREPKVMQGSAQDSDIWHSNRQEAVT